MTQTKPASKPPKQAALPGVGTVNPPMAGSLAAHLMNLDVGDCHSVSSVYPYDKPIDIRAANEDKNALTRRLTARVHELRNKYPHCAKREFEIVSTTGLSQVGYLIVTAVAYRTK